MPYSGVHILPEEYISVNHAHLIYCRTVSATRQDGGWKQRGQIVTIQLKNVYAQILTVLLS